MASGTSQVVRQALRNAAPAFGVAFLISATANLCVILVSIYNMELYMGVLNTRNFRTLTAMSVGLLVVGATYFAVEYLRSVLSQATAGHLLRRLALPTVMAAAGEGDQPIRDLNELRGFVAGPALGVLFDMLWTPMFLVALFLMHWGYGVYGVVSAIIIVGFNLLTEILTKRKLTEANDAALNVLAHMASMIRNPEPVEAMGMFPALERRWRRSQAIMLDLTYEGLRRAKTIAAITKASRSLITAGMVALGLVMCLNGEVSAGSMIAGNLILARMLLPFERVVATWKQWVDARAALARIDNSLSTPTGRRSARALPRPAGLVVMDRLAYMPKGVDRPILRGLSATINPGETVGIVGPSAAGKSTLLRLILGIVEPGNGGVYLDGSNTFLWERHDFARHVGYLPQRVALTDGSVAENICRLADAPLHEIVAAARKAGVHEMIAALPHGYDTPVSDTAYTLSGGQRQRIGLARALFGDPCLLVLDEPNANLDQDGEDALLESLAQARRAGTTIIMVTHRPSLAAMADRLLLLRDGAAEAFDSPEKVQALMAPARPTLVRGAA